jgi:hypothetical protein
MAADRTERDRTTPAPAPTPSIFIPAPVMPSSVSTPSHNSGSIKSSSSVSTNSGGNSGGNVTTGDQTAIITVVNIGPTSQNTQVISPAPQQPAPAPECIGRDCPRTR